MLKNELARPSAVVLDLDNTLYEYEACNKAGYEAVSSVLKSDWGVPERRFNLELSKARSIVKSRVGATAASHNRILYFSELASQLSIPVGAADLIRLDRVYWRSYFSTMALDQNAEKFILALRTAGIPIFLITDLVAVVQYQKLVKLGLSEYFEAIFTSEECGGDKVTGKPFEVFYSCTDPELHSNIWFIGDSLTDYVKRESSGSSRFFLKSSKLRIRRDDSVEYFRDFSKLLNFLAAI